MLRGEVWTVELIYGSGGLKEYPCVIVNRDSLQVLPYRLIVPIVPWINRYSAAFWLVPINPSNGSGIPTRSAADTFQVRCLENAKFKRKLGHLSDVEMQAVTKALSFVVS